MIRCLIIDDNSFDRKLLRQAAERCQLQFRLHEAADIRSAENMLEVQNFDCIILDFLLPDGDGLSFARRFLATAESEFPVIMITGKGSEQVMREAFQLGILDYLTKDSVSPESLERVVVNAIAKVRLQRARQAIVGDTLKDALRQFAVYLAHDFKAPINEIKASCRSLSENYHNALDEEGQRLLRAAEHAADRADKLIHSMFAYAHLQETGEQRDPVSLQSAVDDAVANLAGLIETAGATIRIGDLPTVLGVEPELMQLFRYLINNALEFRDRERALLVCIDAWPVSTNTWEVSVQDNGTGLAGDDQERMFNMSKRQDAYERSSIRLAACKRIVENHGGRLLCRSATGVGSTFVFTLHQDGIATPNMACPASGYQFLR